MAFNFGAANPTPAPFGATAGTPGAPASTNAPAPFGFGGGTPAASTPAPGGLSFGSSQPAPAPSFGFSGNAPTAVAGTPAPAFTFGSTAANTPAPGNFGGSAAPSAAAPATGFAFGATTPAPAPSAFSLGPTTAPATNAFSLSGATPAPGALATTTTTQQQPGMEVPAMSSLFPNEKVYDEITMLLSASESASEGGREAASELVQRLQCSNDEKALGKLLSSPKTLAYSNPDANIRNQLQTNPSVILPGQREATLVPEMLGEVIRIADDLRISEREALCLFAEVSNDERRLELEDQLQESFIDKSLADDKDNSLYPLALGRNVVKAAKELYFLERGRLSQLLLLLVQTRIQADQQPWGELIIQATDSLLQNNLIDNLVKIIREWTEIIVQIEAKLSLSASMNSFSAFPKEQQRKKHFDMVHLQFAVQERQIAAETLFYLAYHTQFTAGEVAGVIDVIKVLSNGINQSDKGLTLLNPFHDVPSSYQNPPHQVDTPWAPYQSNPGPLKEKTFLEWEKQLVKKTCQTTMPDLLRCVSALVMTVISSLDSKQTLVDRQTHRVNSFGVGNKLCPPGETSTSGLEPIHNRLTADGCAEWKRTDVCGLLCASYAMLLRSSPVLLSSPRAGSSSPSRARMRVFIACITAPMYLKSVTFARLCLLPALQRPSRVSSSACDSSEFFLSVLSEYVANFLETLSHSGNLPLSRKTWKREQDEGLQLKRDNQKQRREFKAWSGNRDDSPEEAVPKSVDLMARPDCMDDIAAFAIAVASLGSDYAIKFWSVSSENETHKLVPSRTLLQLKAMASKDDSLPPFYVAMLASLAGATNPSLSDSGASTVSNLLADPNEVQTSWTVVLSTLRWYFRQYDNSGSSAATSTGASMPPTNNYYYQRVMQQQQPPKSAQSSKPFQELGEANIFNLLGMLGLITNVASVSAEARLQILSTKLPITNENTGAVLGTDATLNVLFALSVAPLPPEVRGATLGAIANLICMDGLNDQDKAKMLIYATSAWELLEGCQILPVVLLDQIPPPIAVAQLNRSSGLKFPASSTSLAGSEASNKCPIPVDQTYAILYEMEHVESAKGRYTSTEGFIRLLNALFSCCSPSDLGKHWRLRTGCTPYVEYICHYVLPRATGSMGKKIGKLPFRSKADQVRLVSLALEVIETILVRYPMATGLDKQGGAVATDHAYRLLGQRGLAEKLVLNSTGSHIEEVRDDFENKLIDAKSLHAGGLQSQTPASFQGGPSSAIPRPKSPGFVVMANILSVSNSEVLTAILALLADLVPSLSSAGIGSSRLAETYALFKDTPPTMTSAKHAGKKDVDVTSSMREKLLEGLRPSFEDPQSFSGAVSWQERCVMHALQILCATAVREEAFYTAVTASRRQLQIVPIVRFDKPVASATELCVDRVHIARLFDRLSTSRDIIQCLIGCVGYSDASSDEHNACIAAGGLSTLFYIQQALRAPSIESLFGNSPVGHRRVRMAVARRMMRSFERCEFLPDSEMLALILSWLLSDCRRGEQATGLAHLLLGIGARDQLFLPGSEPQDCFAAILLMVNEFPFIVNEETSLYAANCFEIMVRLCDLKHVNNAVSLQRALAAMERLRSVSFWKNKLEFFSSWGGDRSFFDALSTPGHVNCNTIHSMAWILLGAATELHVLAGFSPSIGNTMPYIPPRPNNGLILANVLFGSNDDVVGNIVRHLPLQRLALDAARSPPQAAIRMAGRPLDGATEVTAGYSVLDKHALLTAVSHLKKEHFSDFEQWAELWNMAVKLDCAVSHLSEVLRLVIDVCLPYFVGETPGGFGLPLDSLLTQLSLTVARLEGMPEGSQYSARATWNLSWVVLVLSQAVAAVAEESGGGMDDLRRLRDQLALSVRRSGRRSSGNEASFHNERTAMLGAAMTEIMQAMRHDESTWDKSLALDVANVLASISLESVNQGSTTGGTAALRPTRAAIIARSSLGAFIMIWDEDVGAPLESLAHTVLSGIPPGEREPNAIPLLRLVGRMDLDVIGLVVQLVQIPFVGNLLLEAGLMRFLANAAEIYMTEEQRLLSVSNSRNVSIGFPPTLYRHLQIFRALMATSAQLSDAHMSMLPQQFFAVLGRYRIAIEPSFSRFAEYGKELCLLVQCWAQLSKLTSPATNSTLQDMPIARVECPYRGSVCETMIVETVLKIAENPLPENCVAELPYSFTKLNDAVASEVVQSVDAPGASWWESKLFKSRNSGLNGTLRNFDEWTEEDFAHAVLGTDILKPGLRVLMESGLRNLRFELLLVRGLFRLCKAAELIQQQLELLHRPQYNIMMQTDVGENSVVDLETRLRHLRELGPKISSCAHRLLLALVMRVKVIRLETENRSREPWSEYFKAVNDLLQYTDLESQGIPCTLGTKEQNSVRKLVESLRLLVVPYQ